MEKSNVKLILGYCQGISETVRDLKKERDSMDRAKDESLYAELTVKITVLERDGQIIRDAMNMLYGRYRGILKQRYVFGYSWAKIACHTGYPDSTCRNWHGKGLERMGERLDTVPMIEEILERVFCARK